MPVRRSSRSGAWPGEEQASRSVTASPRRERGADRRALLGAADVARGRGDADERLELALRPRGDLPRAVPDPVVHTQMHCMPELPEMEIVARRLDAALPGQVVESALAPGINALKTFDPPLHALEGQRLHGRRSGAASCSCSSWASSSSSCT